MSKVLKKYGLINNFLLQRLWNELPFGFTWEAIYKYLNASRNIEYFMNEKEFEFDEEGNEKIILIPIIDKTKIIKKIVNTAKTQEDDVLQYIAEIYNNIVTGAAEDILIGRAYEKDKPKKHLGNSKPKPFVNKLDDDYELDSNEEQEIIHSMYSDEELATIQKQQYDDWCNDKPEDYSDYNDYENNYEIQ